MGKHLIHRITSRQQQSMYQNTAMGKSQQMAVALLFFLCYEGLQALVLVFKRLAARGSDMQIIIIP